MVFRELFTRSRSGSEGQKLLSEKYRALGRMQYGSYSILHLIVSDPSAVRASGAISPKLKQYMYSYRIIQIV